MVLGSPLRGDASPSRRTLMSTPQALWEILAKSVQKTFSCKVEFKPVTSRIFKCQSHLAIKFYSYFWWISRNLNKVLKNHRNFAFYQSFGRFFQVFLTYTLSEHVRACNFKTGKCIITWLNIKCWIFLHQLVPKGFMPSKPPHPHSKIYQILKKQAFAPTSGLF